MRVPHSHLQIVYISWYIQSDNRAFVKIRLLQILSAKLYICIFRAFLHAILRAGTLITGHLLTLRFNRHSFGLQFQKPLPILCIHTNVWGITIIRVIKYLQQFALCRISVLSQSWWEYWDFFSRVCCTWIQITRKYHRCV